MDRYLVISSDCHAGLRPERYRDYLDPQYREEFDRQHAARLAMLAQAGFGTVRRWLDARGDFAVFHAA